MVPLQICMNSSALFILALKEPEMITNRELMLAAFAVFFAGYCSFTTIMLIEISKDNRAQQRAFVCFNEAGKYTSDFGKECRKVALRELKH